MGRIVGIDTSVSLLANVQTNLTYLQDAIAWLGGRPAVAIRPLGNGGGGATPVTADEINALLAQGIAVGAYYNSSTLDGTATASAELGQADAKEAIQQADAVGLPDGTYVWNDLENSIKDNPANNPDDLAAYIQAWADTMRASRLGGAGGFYGIMLPDSLLANALVQALTTAKNSNVARLVLWPAEWIVGAGGFSLAAADSILGSWKPNVPPQLAGMVRMVQVSGADFDDIVDLNVIDPSLLQPGAGLILPSPPSSGQPVAPGAAPGSIALPATVPAWAAPALRDALSKGVIQDASGGSDFYRAIVVLDRLGLLKP